MLVRTHNELVEQRKRLMIAAGYGQHSSAHAAVPQQLREAGTGGTGRGGGSDGCSSVMPETPEHEPLAPPPATDMPTLQLGSASPPEVPI